MRSLLHAGLMGAALLAAAAPAAGQGIAVVVNNQAITQYEIANRQRLLTLTSGGRAASVTQATDELIDERLKLQEARRLNIRITDAQVETAFGSIAQRSRLTVETMTRALAQRGVNASTLRDRLRADLGWQQVVQQRAQRQINIRDQDIVEAIRRRGQDPNNVRTFEYRLSQVSVFGQTPERRRAAEALRTSINGCDTLRTRVAAARDAAVRDPVRRTGAELPQQLRELLERTPVGRATPLQDGERGYEFAVVCDRRDIPGREAVSAQIRQELMTTEMEQVSRRLLDEARGKATIERRR